MKKMKLFLIAALAIFAMSCNENRIYEEHNSDFSGHFWAKSNIVEFSPEIPDTLQAYKVYLALRHVYGFPLKSINVNVSVTSPSGVVSSKSYVLQVGTDSNEYLSDCAGDYCDLETLVEDNFKFSEAGKYKYAIRHEVPLDSIPNVMLFGLIIDKTAENQ